MPEIKATREAIIAAAQPFIAAGIKNPDDLLNSEGERAMELWRLYDEWVQEESRRIKGLPIDEAVHASIALYTIWYDAGFTDPGILDEISGDWLVNSSLELADQARRRDLANEVKAKIREIQAKIKEQDRTYEIWDPDSKVLSDWNAPRSASPQEFYAEYAYFVGPDKATVDEALGKYMQFHSEADDKSARLAMEQAVSEYTERQHGRLNK